MKDIKLHKRLLELLYINKEEHVGSCYSCIDIIDDIFSKKKKDDIFILSNGHAAYALYAVLEKYHNIDAQELVNKHGSHPNHDETNNIFCSTGSLGMGILIAVGRALANPSRKVYVMISDGEAAEGSVWEALKFIYENKIKNIEVFINANGYACYDEIDINYLENRCKAFLPNINFCNTEKETFPFPFLHGLDAHYIKINEEQYKEALEILNNEC